jgi:hypothetical protein
MSRAHPLWISELFACPAAFPNDRSWHSLARCMWPTRLRREGALRDGMRHAADAGSALARWTSMYRRRARGSWQSVLNNPSRVPERDSDLSRGVGRDGASGAEKWTTGAPQYVTPASLHPRTRSHSPRNDVAVNLSLEAHENNPVPSWITLVPFQLVIWYGNFGPVGNVSLSIRDDGDVTILVYLEEVCFVCVGLTTAGHFRVVRLS